MDNTQKFTGKAEGYEKFRPSYPSAVYEYIRCTAGLTEDSVIADVGAGTGKFASGFLTRGFDTFCIEPNADMKAQMDLRFAAFPNYKGLFASAEETTLPNASVDCVTAAQAFHWFRRSDFRAECKRILRPCGKVFLIWNHRDESSAVTRAHGELNARFCSHFVGFSGGMSEIDAAQFDDFFLPGTCRVRIFSNDIRYDSADAFVGRALSSSYAPQKNDMAYDAYAVALADLFQYYAENGVLNVKNDAVVYTGDL